MFDESLASVLLEGFQAIVLGEVKDGLLAQVVRAHP